jgi:hypothetical protein
MYVTYGRYLVGLLEDAAPGGGLWLEEERELRLSPVPAAAHSRGGHKTVP